MIYRTLTRYNKHLILLSVLASAAFGMLTPNLFSSIQFLGTLFINLLKLFALPLICSALISTLGNLSGNLRILKTLSLKTISYMLLSEVLAVMIALTLFNLFRPGVGLNPNLILGDATYTPSASNHFGFTQFIISIFPDNIFYSLNHFDLLPVVIFSIMFGVACSLLGDVAKPFVQLATSVKEISSKCLHGVMLLAPLGIFSLVGAGIAQANLSGSLSGDIAALLSFVGVFVLGLILHAIWQAIFAAIASKQTIGSLLQKSAAVFSTAFGTSSSVATLPVAMIAAGQMKAKPFVSQFMLPLCASINVGGMMMYEMAAALFFSQMLGLELTLSQQILLAIACILGGMAEGGIPETSMVSLVVVFRIVNIPLSAITILLPLDRILDRLRTMVNIFGNLCGVVVVSRWTQKEDLQLDKSI